MNYTYQDYTKFVYYLSMCVMMATIATCSIAERTNIDTYIFFSFVTSGFIFPIGLAWCWNDGWLQNLGFIDYGGASIVHIMGGLAGFIGTYLIGPRVGLFSTDDKLSYILDDQLLDDDSQEFDIMEANKKEEKQMEKLMAEKSKEHESLASKKDGQNIMLEGTPKNSPITSEKVYRPSSILEMYSGKKSVENFKSPGKSSPLGGSIEKNIEKMEQEVI